MSRLSSPLVTRLYSLIRFPFFSVGRVLTILASAKPEAELGVDMVEKHFARICGFLRCVMPTYTTEHGTVHFFADSHEITEM